MKTTRSRREFIKVSAAGALGALVFSNYSCKNSGTKVPGIMLQLYSIRDAMAADVPGSRGVKRTDYGVEVLTSNLAAARAELGGRAVYDKATLEDIMFYISRGNAHA